MKNKLEESIRINNQLEMHLWGEREFLSVEWWVITILSIVFLVLFLLLLDRSRTLLITIAFLVSFILVGAINETGYFFGLWNYPYEFVPFMKTMNAVDFITVPVIITLLYQFFSRWKYYIWANIILFLFVSYIIVPLFVYFNFYVLHKWSYTLSFITLLIVSFMVKTIVDWIYRKSKISY